MKKERREFIKQSAAAGAGVIGALSSVRASGAEKTRDLAGTLEKIMNTPVLRTELFKQPVKIASTELLKNGAHFLVRVRSTDGATGIADAHGPVLKSTYPIMLNRVLPFFAGKDARELESLIRGVYLHESNYKWQGLPFWVSVAGAELAILDLLGKVAGKSLGQLFGDIVRKEVAVYRASSHRGNSAEEEVQYLKQVADETGARAVKFRLGGRMHYTDETTRRDTALIPLTRKVLGEQMTIYADANGSYDVPQSIRIGRLMEEHKLSFFEEPVPFDYYEETKQVADALRIPIAGGEEESSLRQFRWMIENGVVQIVQPDLLYFGGLTRSLRVARMAAAAGMDCTPHMSASGLGYVYVLHFASCVPNAGPFQEFKGVDKTLPVASNTSSLKSEKGIIKVPTGPGLGLEFDPDFVRKATIVSP